ncbi:MAG: hypothetical protein MZV70_50800 [Desulfobacterales bacterium]|nr:hypothetical protein [Desulfobacterales bacterium]
MQKHLGLDPRCAVLFPGRAEAVAAGPGRHPAAQDRDALPAHRDRRSRAGDRGRCAQPAPAAGDQSRRSTSTTSAGSTCAWPPC